MLKHGFLRRLPITRATWFKVAFVDQGYACKNPSTASIYPVPPGSTRVELYCGQCQAAKCLFTGRSLAAERAQREEAQQEEIARREEAQQEERARQRQRGEARKARLRARGLGTTGQQPLRPVCWNCSELRVKLGGYVCRLEPEARPSAMRKMIRRSAELCRSFAMRRVMEIPTLL